MKAEAHYNKGLNHLVNEQPESAYKEFKKAVLIEPDNADYLSEMGVALFHLNKKLEAIEALRKALLLEPENPYRYSSLAYLKDSIGDTQGAIDDYNRCIELDPEDAVAFNNLGLLEEKLGRKQAAQKHFRRADELAKILSDNNIIVERPESPRNIQSEINQERKELKQKGKLGIMKDVFTDSVTRKEFLKFIRRGFKNDQDDVS